jgi:hypothetical protein
VPESPIVGRLTERVLRELFVDWFGTLLDQEYGSVGYSTGGERNSIRLRDGTECTAVLSETTGDIAIEAPSAIQDRILSLAQSALARTKLRETGEPVWWTTGFTSRPETTEASTLHMLRSLSQHKRYEGKWRLGTDALVDIKQQGAQHPPFFPNQSAKVVFRSVGPGHGPFAARIARTNATLIRAALSFITASPLEGLMVVFPANPDDLVQARDLLDRGVSPELLIDSVPIWRALATFVSSGSHEAFERAFGALLAYEHALVQKTEESSIVFFVTAIEALAVPNANWKTERITKRFVEFLLLICPEAIDEVLRHPNFRQAFGNISSRKAFAQQLYHLRSHPIHTGRLGEITAGLSVEVEAGVRVALAADVARAAILSFLRTPLSMLVGHPDLDPVLRIEVSPEVLLRLRKCAAQAKLSVTEWILKRVVASMESSNGSDIRV